MGSLKDKFLECAICGLLIVSIYSHQCPNGLPNFQFSSFVKPLDNNYNLACELKNGGIEPLETQSSNTTTTTVRNIVVPFSGTATSTATGGTFLPFVTTTTTS